jgi:hypothetical protein
MEKTYTNLVFHNLSALILSFGIKNTSFTKFTMVDILPNQNKTGNRKFEMAVLIATDLCKIMNIELEVITFQDRSKVSNQIKNDSVIDISVIRHLALSKSLIKKTIVLGTGLENLAITSPKLLQVLRDQHLIPQFKRRIDVLRIFIIPFRISKIYTLTPKTTKVIGITSKKLDYKKIENILWDISKNLHLLNTKSSALQRILMLKESTLFVIPLAEVLGGTYSFNLNIINKSIEFANKNFIKNIVIKNHPADDTDYLKDLSRDILIRGDLKLIQMNDEFDRTIPIEILAFCASDFALYGFISAAHFSLMNFPNRGMTICLPNYSPNDCVWSDYSIGYAKPNFNGTIVYF